MCCNSVWEQVRQDCGDGLSGVSHLPRGEGPLPDLDMPFRASSRGPMMLASASLLWLSNIWLAARTIPSASSTGGRICDAPCLSIAARICRPRQVLKHHRKCAHPAFAAKWKVLWRYQAPDNTSRWYRPAVREASYMTKPLLSAGRSSAETCRQGSVSCMYMGCHVPL